MNYYNPYYMFAPMARPSLFGALRNSIRGINLGGILNGTQRTLGLINQAIPLVKEVAPVMKNARTMFRVMNEFKKTNPTKKVNNNYSYNNYSNDSSGSYNETHEEYGAGPTFFV